MIGGAIAAAGFVVFGLILFGVLRKYLIRARLTNASLLAIFATAIYSGIAFTAFQGMPGGTSWWIHRAYAAVLVFAAIRFLDRLLIVPVLTRGGKMPLQRFIHQIITIVVGLFAILGFGAYAFGWDIKTFLAGSAVVSIVLGLALQETLGNFFSGLVMQASSPFAIGDWIICAGVEGRVVDMTWRAVTIHTLEDNWVIVPNGTVAKEQIVNYNTPTTATARIVTVGLEYDLPPGDAIAVLKSAALETHGVSSKPEPFIFLEDFADSAVVYKIKFWINEPALHKKIEHAVRANLWYRLKQKGYNIPFPIRTVEHTRLDHKQRRQDESSAQQRYDSIANSWLFAPLSEPEKRAVASGATDVFLGPGQILFHQDDPGESCFIIRQGEVDVFIRAAGSASAAETKVATLKAGDFFGEMSALTGQPRTASIRAVTNLACVEIGKEALNSVFAADPAMMEKISRLIAERNAARETIAQDAAAAASSREQAVTTQQKSLLGRMMKFFSRGAESSQHKIS